jgi:hypothetical protein
MLEGNHKTIKKNLYPNNFIGHDDPGRVVLLVVHPVNVAGQVFGALTELPSTELFY